MRKAPLVGILLTALVALASCSSEMGLYENVLDRDREAREKMTAALSTMRDVQSMLEVATEEEKESEAIEVKRQEAVDAFAFAITSWNEAEGKYRQLIKDHPSDPVYLNNLANMIYFKAYNGVISDRGLDADLEEAEQLLEKAVELEERTIFRRNLELIVKLREDEEVKQEAEENRRIAEGLGRLAEAGGN